MNAQVLLNIPDLDRKFEALWRDYQGTLMLGGLEHWDRHSEAYRDAFILLITKASRSYRLARKIVLGHQGLDGPQPNMVIIEFPFAFEDCINSASQAISIGDFLVGEDRLHGDFKIAPHRVAAKKIKTLRDMLQHLVPRVLDNRKDGDPIRLTASTDAAYVQLGNFKLSFIEVVEVLRWLFDAAKYLIPDFDESAAEEMPPAPFDFVLGSPAVSHGASGQDGPG